MTTLQLTDMVVRTAKPSAAQYTIYDTLLPGFGLRVGATTKTFVVTIDRKTRRRITLGRYPALKLQEARAEARRLKLSHSVARQSLGIVVIPFSRALETFIQTYLPDNRRSTAAERERILRKHCLPRWRTRAVSDITRDDINRITDSLLDTPVLANNVYACIRLFFRWSLRRGYADRSPCDALQQPTRRVDRDRVLSPDEHRLVAQAAFAAPYPFGSIVSLCLLTGQRRGELAQLRWAWIDATARTITFPAHVTKNNRQHTIPYGDLVAQVLAQIPTYGELLFPARGHIHKAFCGWSKCKAAFDKRVPIDPWTLHDLRRTYSTTQAQLHTPPHITERLLNHVTGSLTPIALVYNRYSFLPEMRVAAEKFEHYIAQFSPQPRRDETLAKLPESVRVA